MPSRDWFRDRPRTACLVACVAGAVLVCAFAPVNLSPLALASPALLVYLWLCAGRARDAAWIGFSFGLGLFAAGVSWVYVSLSVYGGMPPAVAAFATIVYCAFLSWPLALAGYIQHRLPAGEATRVLFVVPAVWMLAEMLRGLGLTGFPWLLLGYAAVDTPIAEFATLAGVYGASLVVMVCAGSIVMVATGHRRVLGLAVLGALFATGAALRTLEWTQPFGKPLVAAVLQGNVAQDLKFDPERYEKTLDTYARLAVGTKASLIVMPETALPRFLDRVDPAYLEALDSIANRNGGDILIGAPYRRAVGKNPKADSGTEQFFNVVVTRGVSRPQIYYKIHLVPFGEFVLPGFSWIVNFLQIPMSEFSSGRKAQKPLAVAGQQVAVSICYEDVFGEEIIRPLPEATLLANVSNMAWFGDSLAPGQHLQMARMRTIETGRAMLIATNTGMTAAIDRGGRVLGKLPQYTEGRLEVLVSGYSGATPFVLVGNWLALAVAALLIALSVVLRKR